MKKKTFLVYILAASMIFSLSGCRAKITETETETTTSSETESETVKETETEKTTEKQSETQKATEKASSTGTSSSKSTSSKDKSTSTEKNTSTEKTTVKPSTIQNNTQNTESASSSAGTQMCPYCYQQISLASDGAGSTIYADHVAQEKAWSDYMNSTEAAQTTPSTDTPSTDTPSTDASTPETSSTNSDTAQCPYCYQYFTVSDGSYSAHLDAENSSLGLPEGSDYITCPLCGNTYQSGVEYDTHYCTGVNNE